MEKELVMCASATQLVCKKSDRLVKRVNLIFGFTDRHLFNGGLGKRQKYCPEYRFGPPCLNYPHDIRKLQARFIWHPLSPPPPSVSQMVKSHFIIRIRDTAWTEWLQFLDCLSCPSATLSGMQDVGYSVVYSFVLIWMKDDFDLFEAIYVR